ncbi:hypothetical protein I7I48_05896 [Histoplasma ohiense]|nr:hypothetical protein I7I48_05896 [Histoplasma ohiense (nom. inval.)]
MKVWREYHVHLLCPCDSYVFFGHYFNLLNNERTGLPLPKASKAQKKKTRSNEGSSQINASMENSL